MERYLEVSLCDGTRKVFYDVPDEDPYLVARHSFFITESGALVIELNPPTRAQEAGVYHSTNIAAFNHGIWDDVRAIYDERRSEPLE